MYSHAFIAKKELGIVTHKKNQVVIVINYTNFPKGNLVYSIIHISQIQTIFINETRTTAVYMGN